MRSDRSTKLAKGRCRAEQWRCGQNDHDCEQQCFADEIASRLFLKILTANISKRWCLNSGTSCLISVEPHRLIIAFNQWKAPAITSCWSDCLHVFILCWPLLMQCPCQPMPES